MPALSLRTPPLCIKLSPPRLATHRCTIFAYQPVTPVSPFFATLTRHLQPAENNATLSALSATLTALCKPKSFVCHSYKKHGGVGCHVPPLFHRSTPGASATRRNARNSNPLKCLPHNSRTPRGWGSARRHRPADSEFSLQPSTFNIRLFPLVTIHQSRVTSHEPTHL
jgi:hypothetical protein